MNAYIACIRAACQVPRSIYAATSFATTRIICGLTDIKCSSPKILSSPTGKPYQVRKYHYSLSTCYGLLHDAVNRAVRHRIDRSPVFSREKVGVMALLPGSLSFRTGLRVTSAYRIFSCQCSREFVLSLDNGHFSKKSKPSCKKYFCFFSDFSECIGNCLLGYTLLGGEIRRTTVALNAISIHGFLQR